ncbi:MAG: hypothetical protein WC683_04740 [bacterium]
MAVEVRLDICPPGVDRRRWLRARRRLLEAQAELLGMAEESRAEVGDKRETCTGIEIPGESRRGNDG